MYMNVVTKVDPGPYQNFLILLVLLIVVLVLVVVIVWFRQIFLIVQLCKQCVCPTTIQEVCEKDNKRKKTGKGRTLKKKKKNLTPN